MMKTSNEVLDFLKQPPGFDFGFAVRFDDTVMSKLLGESELAGQGAARIHGADTLHASIDSRRDSAPRHARYENPNEFATVADAPA